MTTFKFTGPDAEMSCDVYLAGDSGVFIAYGMGWVGSSGVSPAAAALDCFAAWQHDLPHLAKWREKDGEQTCE